MSNEIYEKSNKEEYPLEVAYRVVRALNLIKPFLKQGSISDVSCGNMFIGKQLNAKYFYDYYPCSSEVIFCDLYKDSNERVQKANNVIFAHALEHFVCPSKILNNLVSNFLKINGRLFIFVPNADYPSSNHTPFLTDIGHFSYFTRDRLLDLIDKNDKIKLVSIIDNFQEEGFEELIAIVEKVG